MEILLSCVSHNDAAWVRRVQDLVRSVRWFGGSVSGARFIANFVGEVPREVESGLRDLGADVRVVEPISPRFPHLNKLRMLELDEAARFDVLVALDCDMVIVDDFADRVPEASVGAKPVDYDPFTDHEWRRIYETADLDPPPKILRATSSGEPVGLYFNSGVVTVPRALCGDLHREWHDRASAMGAAYQRERHAIGELYLEQSALGVAIQHAGLPWVPLPVAMNFPCHMPVHLSALESSPPPAILHYHDRVDRRGFLERPACAAAAPAADQFNRRRAEHLGLPYEELRRRPVLGRMWRSARGRTRRVWRRRHRIRTLVGARRR